MSISILVYAFSCVFLFSVILVLVFELFVSLLLSVFDKESEPKNAKKVEKIAKANNTSFNNVIVSMIEFCLLDEKEENDNKK